MEMEEKSIFMRGSSLIMRMPSRWILSKPTKARTLSIASGGDAVGLLLLEAEAPEVDEWGAGHVIAPTRVARDDDGLQEDLAQHRVHKLRLIAVDR